jgi:hypothetical protein
VFQHLAKLHGEQVKFLVGENQASEAGNFGHVISS